MHFTELGLAEPIVRAVSDEGYASATPIQAEAIPAALSGRDVLGCAKTGTGKTGAFLLPILDRLSQHNGDNQPASKGARRKPRALVLCPTRELASQINDSLKRYGRHLDLRHLAIFGGVNQTRQVERLRSGIDVLVATPGRLIDLMNQRKVRLDAVEVLVLDEADRMLDMGFIHDIRHISEAIQPVRQTLLFSATMPPALRQLVDAQLTDPVRIQVAPISSTADAIEQTIYQVPKTSKTALLQHLLANEAEGLSLVFSRTKHGADRIVRKLRAAGIQAEAIHSNKSQAARTKALNGFRTGRTRVLVATDIASRGIDVDGIGHVFNYDLPMEAETYVHRIGRTARAGRSGVAVSFCDETERSKLRAIERLTKQKIERAPLPDLAEPPSRTQQPPAGQAPPSAGRAEPNRPAPSGVDAYLAEFVTELEEHEQSRERAREQTGPDGGSQRSGQRTGQRSGQRSKPRRKPSTAQRQRPRSDRDGSTDAPPRKKRKPRHKAAAKTGSGSPAKPNSRAARKAARNAGTKTGPSAGGKRRRSRSARPAADRT